MVISDVASDSGSSSSAKGKSRVLEYYIETVSDDLIDCRLQIVHPGASKAVWYRERSLSEDDEIVDKLVDARTGRIAWTSHRPVRGWYLHLQLPFLPREKGIPLRPVKSNRVGCTPLSLSLGTRLDTSSLHQIDSLISQPWTGNQIAEEEVLPKEDNRFTTVSLDRHEESSSEPTREMPSHARSSSATISRGHARRRSGRISATKPSSRHVSRSSQVGPLGESQEGSGDGKSRGTTEIETYQAGPRVVQNISPQPEVCHFLLTDDVQARSTQSQVSWSRWAWNSMPASMRSPLSLDSSKTFSVLWLGAPIPANYDSTIEVIRYEDDAAWWNWKGKRRGRILVQEEAVKALRLDLAFWMAVSFISNEKP